MEQNDSAEFAQSLIGKSPYEIYKAIRDLDKEKGEGTAMAALLQSNEFGKYCAQQLKAFLDNRLALTKRDADNIDKWWKFSTNNFSLEEIQAADAKVFNKKYIRSERYFDFDHSKTFELFKNNIPDIQEEMDMPQIKETEHIRLQQRQKIVDFIRLAQRDKESSAQIKNENWNVLIDKFEHFPTIPAKTIGNLIDNIQAYNVSNPQRQRVEQEAFMARILIYRLENICLGTWRPNPEEVKFWKNYLQNKNFSSSIVQETLQKLDEIEQQQNNSSQSTAENINSEPHTDEKTENKEEAIPQKNRSQSTVINFFEDNEENIQHLSEQNDDVSEPNNKIEGNSSTNNSILNINELNDANENVSYREDDEAAEAPEEAPQKIEEEVQKPLNQQTSASAIWKNKTLFNWQNWSKQSNKIVQEYKPQEQAVLAFKIYDNPEKAKAGEYDADITYRKENDMVVKGYKGKVPSDEVFANIVAQAKKNGPEICFGNIKSSIFKAKLMLACLNDKDVKMVNPPKLSELTDLPEDLKAKLKEKLPRPIAHAQERMDKLNKEKTGYSRSKNDNKDSSDKSSELNPALKKKISEKSNGI